MTNSDVNRAEQYKKDEIQEHVLKQMNKTLFPKELELIKDFDKPQLPVIFIVGAQRSGTTLLMQLLTQYFDLSYPNNFIARYWAVPFTGAVLYKSLTKNTVKREIDFSSDLGYTKGLNGPHEFGYFWKKWFPWESWEQKKYNKIDYTILQKQLAAWESVNNSPLIFKNLIQNDYNIIKLKEIFPNAFFLFIKRDLTYNIQSTFQSRLKLFNDENEWFGVQPKKYNRIAKLPVFEQIASQITSVNQEIEEQLEVIPEEDIIRISYEDLVKNYKSELKKINSKLNLVQNTEFDNVNLVSGNEIKIDKKSFEQILSVVKSS